MKLIRFLGFSVAALAAAANASASIIPTFIAATTAAGVTTYSYDVNLDAQQNLITGSQLCFAGIGGLTGTPTAVAGWTAADSSGACPLNAVGTTTPNTGGSVLYTYTAAPTISGPPLGVDLGTFTFQSTVPFGTGNIAYGAVAQKASDLSMSANQGEVNGPVATPEPATLSFLGASLVGLGLMKRRAPKK